MQTTAYDRAVDKALDFLIYGGFFATLIWSILKSIGVIHTPAFVQQLPVITASAGILGFAYKVGRYAERIEQRLAQHDIQFAHINNDLTNINNDLTHINKDLAHINKDPTHIDNDVEHLKRDMDFVKQRV
jgi:hypothetical protein